MQVQHSKFGANELEHYIIKDTLLDVCIQPPVFERQITLHMVKLNHAKSAPCMLYLV